MWRYKLEKKLSFVRIPNLMLIIVVISAFIYVYDHFSILQNGMFFISKFLWFDRYLILKGEIWRIITFIFMPFGGVYLPLVLLQAYFLYFLGTSLEVSLGESKFTLFYIFGVIGCILVGFLTGYTGVFFLNMSMFFVFASINPNKKVLLFYFIPVKTSIIGIVDTIYFIFKIFSGIIRKDYTTVLTAIAAIANYLFFFGPRFFIDMFYQLKNIQENSKRMYRNGNYWGR